jgi:hypothetical protein
VVVAGVARLLIRPRPEGSGRTFTEEGPAHRSSWR